jgi:hypothetical protein
MNTNNVIGIGDVASGLFAVGLTKLNDPSLNTALILIGAGVVLKILVAFLNKGGIQVSSQSQG